MFIESCACNSEIAPATTDKQGTGEETHFLCIGKYYLPYSIF